MTARTSSGKQRAGKKNAGAGAGKGQLGQDSFHRTAVTGHLGRTASENNGDNKNQDMKRGHDGQNMTARTG
jgi:hypothetical protein